MGIVPDKWYDKLKDKSNINPFSAIPSYQEQYALSQDKTTTETRLLRKTMVEADTDFFSIDREKEFQFYEVKAQSHSVTNQWAGKSVLFISRIQVDIDTKKIEIKYYSVDELL